MLIIGKNNIFKISSNKFNYVQHDKVNDIYWESYEKVVITAFDPLKKFHLSRASPIYISDELLKRLDTCKVYYISTARANSDLEMHSDRKYENYIINKKYEKN